MQKISRPRCHTKSPTVQDTFQPIPHQLRWSDWEMGTAVSCTECSQVAGLIQKVGTSSSKVPSYCTAKDRFYEWLASFPGPAQLFVTCSTKKRGEPGIFSREHDVIGKLWKFSEQTGCVSRIVQSTTHSTFGVCDNRPPLARYMR